MSKDNLLNFSYEDVKFKHHIADYYENKKYTFLKISIALLGFGATFINVFNDNLMLIGGGLCLVLSSLLSLLYFAVTSKPDKDIKKDLPKNYKKLTDKDILDINIERTIILSNLIKKKQKNIRIMTFIMFVGLVLFCVMVLANVFI